MPRLFTLALLCLWPFAVHADTDINVVALFNNKAMLIINKGKPQTLSVGQVSREGVKLVAADTSRAVLEVDGKRRELGMGQAATVAGNQATGPASVTLYADGAGHFVTDGMVNGRELRFLVDTGATLIAMNSGDAVYAGIDYKKGVRIPIHTASGEEVGYRVVINTLKLGNVILNQVDCVVLEGGSPAMVLLGMSALNRMEMRRDGITMTLTKKY
ncbi:aspartyl protease family protein [Methylovorus glucosotrophus]|uniref:retropepsin-like aspartic protease family protein n=1 Tax=Methylovorus glucosotrophus TaxID=266009 RepID=UPI0013316F0D|nr:TIGR02281 family clan AA aspartic protease [Methylovorus glucosotrophus]KAF0836451.1 aspartyl protease family protein [Methylovorus glucosotrophus]